MRKPSDLAEARSLDAGALKGPWPIDKLILGYLFITTLLVIVFVSRIPEAWWLLSFKAVGATFIILAWRSDSSASWIFRNWYPAIYLAACYKELNYLIPPLRPSADTILARIDYAMLRVHPTVWIEPLQSKLATEYFQIVYSSFIPALLLVGLLLWRRRFDEFRFYAFLISLGYLVCYVLYFMVPARGPRFLLNHLQLTQLRGLWTFNWFRNLLDTLEGVHYDCFPSGHTTLTLLAWWTSRRLSPKFFYVFGIFTVSQIISTVYLRYHYVVDLFAGALVALLLIATATRLYSALGGGALKPVADTQPMTDGEEEILTPPKTGE